MRKLSFVAAVLALAGSAHAADLYVKGPPAAPAYYDWSGIYVGANAGYGWADMSWNFAAGGGPSTFETHPKGALAGGQIGINKQYGNWVWGTEVTGDWSDLTATALTLPFAVNGTTKLHDLETLTGRLGYAFNNVLFYAKSGGATGVVGLHLDNGVVTADQSQRLWGGTAGAGIEYGLTHNIVVGVEYDFTRLFAGQYNLTGTGGPVPTGANHSFDVQSVTGRVSYKF